MKRYSNCLDAAARDAVAGGRVVVPIDRVYGFDQVSGPVGSRADGELRVLTEEGEIVTPCPSPGAHRRSVAAFAMAVLAGETPNASGVDGLRSMQLCDAIATSVSERRTVEVDYSA